MQRIDEEHKSNFFRSFRNLKKFGIGGLSSKKVRSKKLLVVTVKDDVFSLQGQSDESKGQDW